MFEAFLFLLYPGGVVAFVGNTTATVELQDPARHVIKEVAVVSDHDDRTFILPQVPFQPGNGLRIEMVGRLVKQQQVRFL